MKEKLFKLIEENQIRIAAGVQLLMCTFAVRSIIKKDLRKMKKKYKRGMI